MRAICVRTFLAAMLLVSVSCELNKGTPTPPSPTVTSITFSSWTDVLKVKEAATFTATATHSDNSSASVADWRSDMPTVATVDAVTGKVTGVSAGTATIVATHDGMSATRSIRVVPDFGGTWKGAFRVSSCSGSGRYAEVCGYVALMVGQLEFEFGQDREQVTGTMDYGYSLEGDLHAIGPVPVSGTINTGGHLKLTGAFTNSRQFDFVLRADGNDLYIVADRVLGTFTVDMTIPSNTGPSRVTFGHTISGDGLTKVK